MPGTPLHILPPRYATRVLRLRLKDKHAEYLTRLAREVNFVWNYCNDLAYKIWQRERRFVSAYDLHPYLVGVGKAGLHLHSQTVQAIAEQYVQSRGQHKKTKLAWRRSGPVKRSLGWIAFKASAIQYKNGQLFLAGTPLSLWDSYGLKDFKLGTGNINEDSRGRWYINITIKRPVADLAEKPRTVEGSLGGDPGLETLVTFSDESIPSIDAPRFYQRDEARLANSQRANKKKQVRNIHACIKNSRSDHCHKATTRVVASRKPGTGLYVGALSSKWLSQTNMAKSAADAALTMLRNQMSYKCADAGIWFEQVNEQYSTVTCSDCGARSGPTGLTGLRIREWSCKECGTVHHRDRNAAQNILRRGHSTPAEGIPVL